MPTGSSSPIRATVIAVLAVLALLTVLWQVGSGGANSQALSSPTEVQGSSVAYRAGNGVGVGTTAPVARATTHAAAPAAPAAAKSAPPAAPADNSTSTLVRSGGGDCNDTSEGIVQVTHDLAVRQEPGSGSVIGTVPALSPYLRMPVSAWIRKRSCDGRWGLVTVPWTLNPRSGWIRLDGMTVTPVGVHVEADLSDRTLKVTRNGRVVFRASTAIGAAGSPSPVGDFWINDPVSVGPDQPEFGTYAFGLSALQPHPPQGWTGGNQMAIHGTNAPGSIGTAASAGCLRVSEQTLARLRSLVGPGTPVSIHH